MTLSRRQLLTGSAGLLVAGVLAQILPGQRVFATPPMAAAIAPSAVFQHISAQLTGREHPDGLLSQRLYSWLYQHVPDVESQLTALGHWLSEQGSAQGDDMLKLLAAQPEVLQTLYHDLISGWYLGVVGPLPHPQCIAFENIMSYQQVKTFLSPPSYAPGQPNFWTTLPTRREHV